MEDDAAVFGLLLVASVARDDLSFLFPFEDKVGGCGSALNSANEGESEVSGAGGSADVDVASFTTCGGPGDGGAFKLSFALRCVDHKPCTDLLRTFEA